VWPVENGDRDSNRTWLTWAPQDWGIPNTLLAEATMPHGLNGPKAFVEIGSGTQQTGQTSPHLTVVHRLSWIQGLTLNTRCYSLKIADIHGMNEVSWCPSHLLIWHHLFSSQQGTLTKKMNVGPNCPMLAAFPIVNICMTFGIRQYFYQRNPSVTKNLVTFWVSARHSSCYQRLIHITTFCSFRIIRFYDNYNTGYWTVS
jgi:hypothetical protein